MKFDGSTIGLILSGGGSKGIAHAGVLKFYRLTLLASFKRHLAKKDNKIES